MDSNDPWGQPEEVTPEPDTASMPAWGQFPEPYRPPPRKPPPVNAPVGEKERFASLDVLRGTALFGILLVNIGAFALVRDARYYPFVSGDDQGFDFLAWQISFFGADTKFIQIFTMLFGAGIAVMCDRNIRKENRLLRQVSFSIIAILSGIILILLMRYIDNVPFFTWIRNFVTHLPWTALAVLAALTFWDRSGIVKENSGYWAQWLGQTSRISRRMFFLMVLGLLHTFVLWDGDILYDYAVWGLFIYFSTAFPWPVMLVIVVGLLNVEAVMFVNNITNRAIDYDDMELLLFQGSFWGQLEWRLDRWELDGKFIPLFFGFQAVAHMLLGIVAYRTGFFTGRWYTWLYAVLFVALASVGLYFIGEGTQWRPGLNQEADALKFYWGSFALSLGYCAGLVCLAKAAPRFWITKGLAATGRMALTNYLMQTVICTTIFYGYGFGQFAKWSRFELFVFVIAVFVIQIVYSVIWLRVFQFGPMEWLWRSFTYLKLQPMRRRATVIETASAVSSGAATPPDQDAGGFSSSPPRSM